MIVTCPMCGHYGDINDKLVPKKGRHIVCPKCRESFFISKGQIIHGGQPDTSSGNTLSHEKSEKLILNTDSNEITQTVAGQTDIHLLVCPRCGATVDKPKNLKGNTFHCEYCNSVILVK